ALQGGGTEAGELLQRGRVMLGQSLVGPQQFAAGIDDADAITDGLQRAGAGRLHEVLAAHARGTSGLTRALELTVAPVRSAGQAGGPVDAVVGVLWDVTAARALQARIEAIEAAGAELVKLDSAAVTHMHAAERLRMIEEKIIRAVHEHLQVDTFEIRVINRKTGQLELVTAVGIAPLKIGESIFAKPDGNGISGYVAVTGRSYLCPDVRKDPMYREGLESAASSLTVPLRLHDRVTGVLNLESRELNHFTDNDRLLAELLARHIALALNTLDLLVAERFTTNEQVAGNMLGEIREPLDEIARDAEGLLAEQEVAGSVRAAIARIVAGTSALRSR
ncbi:MAG: GAF domain-containing protein, partial [Myxococcota bacterium]